MTLAYSCGTCRITPLHMSFLVTGFICLRDVPRTYTDRLVAIVSMSSKPQCRCVVGISIMYSEGGVGEEWEGKGKWAGKP